MESKDEEFKITDLITNSNYNIYLVAYDKAGNSKVSETITVIPKRTIYII